MIAGFCVCVTDAEQLEAFHICTTPYWNIKYAPRDGFQEKSARPTSWKNLIGLFIADDVSSE